MSKRHPWYRRVLAAMLVSRAAKRKRRGGR